MNNKKVLLVGGCGFIGSNFCCKHKNFFNKMIILDCLNYAGNEKNIHEIIDDPNVVLIKNDIVNTGLLASNQSFFDLIWLIGYQF